MTQKLSTKLRTALLDGSSLKDAFTDMELRMYGGDVPANADAAAGTAIATCPAVAFGTAAAGVMAKDGVWQDPSAVGGTATYYRLVSATDTDASDGGGNTWPRIQGTVGVGGGGAFDMVVGTTTIVPGDPFTVDFYTQTIVAA